MAHGPYSRVYHELADDYPDIYESSDLADFTRLLVAADQAWPTAARWQGLASKSAMSRMVTSGLIVAEGRSRYRVKGMDKERAARSEKARLAAQARYANGSASGNAPSSANGSANGMPSREEKSRDEKEKGVYGSTSPGPARAYRPQTP